MDPFSAFKDEVFRPIAAVVLPGLLAIAPFVIVACNGIAELKAFYLLQPSWFLAGVISVGTIAGMLIEYLGSSIERGIDRCIDLEYLEGYEKVWMLYLSGEHSDTNGRRFLSATVTRIKFINSMMPALLVFLLGIIVLHIQIGKWSSSAVIYFSSLMFLLLAWMFRTATEMSEVASNTRYCLLSEEKRPIEYNSEVRPVRRVRHFAYVVGEFICSRVSDIDLRGKRIYCVIPDSVALLFGTIKIK
jgi:hypothetical protein